MDETTEQCAIRELEEETGLKVSVLHQHYGGFVEMTGKSKNE